MAEKDLADLALGFDGAQPSSETPLLVPFDGRTLIVYEFSDTKTAVTVAVGGPVPQQLDGVLCSDLSPDSLVTRIVNETAMPSLNLAPDMTSKPVTFSWTKPDDVKLQKVE